MKRSQASRASMIGGLLLAVPLLCFADEPSRDLRLWYSEPAKQWETALPIGCGRLGAMVFGNVADDRIQFNEDTLWTGKPHDYVRAGARGHLDEIRRLLFEGKDKEAAPIVRGSFLSDPIHQEAFQPFGDLHIRTPGHEGAVDYRRELDLDSAVARVTYRVGDVTYRREVFASYPDQVIVVRIEADRKGAVSFQANTTSPHEAVQSRAIGIDTLAMSGHVRNDGLRFESRLRVFNAGGRCLVDDSGVSIEGADAVTMVLSAATSFKTFEDVTADPAARCEATLARLGSKSYESLRADHVADHRKLFRRVTLDLGRDERADWPIDRRVDRISKDYNALTASSPASRGTESGASIGLRVDPALAALYFQFGRYLLIASSRLGSQPANLQGVWNELLDPPWGSKYTTNINVEMNYWPAEATNLSECHEPLFDMIDDLIVSGSRTAREQYGMRGWVVHHNTDLWRGTAPINNIDGVWPTGGAWLCHHLWDRYLYTGDREFLARRAYPAMKGASLFFVDYLVPDPRTGWLVTNPSISPEQDPLCYGPTMDAQLIRSLLSYTIEAAGLLGVDSDLMAKLADVRRRLPPNQVGRHGQLQEWIVDMDKPNDKHRHMSPLWGLFPGWDLTPADLKSFDAAKVLLGWRGDGNTGWSFAWRIPLWARVHDGDFAFRQLEIQLARRTFPSLLDKCGPFQVDGNFGATGGVAELLLQSHLRPTDDPDSREIELLPALPLAWPKGAVTGLRARGGFEVDLAWNGGVLARAVVRSDRGGKCRIRYRDQVLDLTTQPGEVRTLEAGALSKSP
ncbi:glycoside hydrolase family 95 protein [Paludisphaera rhizosphaerae]|uniref:glycoside hydrolase family 95 protein n=1 Tax=Paludisphaera rhizosphaerae TaxID=2711216 RepID=UPI00197F84BF|nr:glycoside hydrolase family 95 protein [Paludisphaera rhizosphaerae]